MSTTPRLALTEITASQAQKEVTLNTDLWRLDAYVQSVIVDRHLTAPPGSPASGACYIVASVATGAWAGKEKYLAQYRNAAWVFFAPFEGLTVFAADENVYLLYDGSAWVLMGTGITGVDTLTLPKINEAVQMTLTSTDLNRVRHSRAMLLLNVL